MTVFSAIKKKLAEALPFVARSLDLQVDWLVGEFRKGVLSDQEVAPYIHLLVSGYEACKERGEGDSVQMLRDVFADLDRDVIVGMIRCAEIYDVPELLDLVRELTVDEAVLVLKKVPPPYEKRSLLLLDRVFQAINACGDHLLERAGEKMAMTGDVPAHFASAYERFREILIDEKILISLYPQAKV